jgi:Tripartite ATP-independent periplasmic transporters, DctQ component
LAIVFAFAGGGIRKLLNRNASPSEKWRRLPAILGSAGIALALLAPGLGSNYAQNWLNWVQNASSLMLIGGLRGLVTRLTLWLALLGASLATASGKHINIDFVLRLATGRTRTAIGLAGWCTAAIMCLTGAWGFVDQLALGEFRVPRTVPCEGKNSIECETAPAAKLSGIGEEFGKDMFLLGKQASLDLRTFPVVLSGKRYDGWLSVSEWNTFAADSAFAAHYGKDKAKTLQRDTAQTDAVLPAVIVPGGEENAAGLLVRDLNLVIPMGLFMIGLRFLLRCLLVIAGLVKVDPNQQHADDDDDTEEAEKASV